MTIEARPDELSSRINAGMKAYLRDEGLTRRFDSKRDISGIYTEGEKVCVDYTMHWGGTDTLDQIKLEVNEIVATQGYEVDEMSAGGGVVQCTLKKLAESNN